MDKQSNLHADLAKSWLLPIFNVPFSSKNYNFHQQVSKEYLKANQIDKQEFDKFERDVANCMRFSYYDDIPTLKATKNT